MPDGVIGGGPAPAGAVDCPASVGGSRTTYQFEPLLRLIGYDDLMLITAEHWRAIALDQADVPLVVDWELYLSQERAGTWRAFTARRGGVLVGYIAFNFSHPTRYRTTLYVQEDTIWVVPDVNPVARALIWRGLWKNALKALPRPCKVQGKIRLNPDEAGILSRTIGRRFGPERILFLAVGGILRSLGLRPVEVLFSTVLK